MLVYQLYQFIEKVCYINVSLITNVSVSTVFDFRSTISMFQPNQKLTAFSRPSIGFIRKSTVLI